ncbi:MarR family winged helix-turn-helix transcriptional regulator [Govanella unica]|uniref:MarR family transcriptional regulator n=1 Tax=Govanella unica TaxID=2975056 RepID=A0A9X3Z6D6_9PROT|nr:MarR family transcriptional regulator [Govania unica]MDA5192962.1 MarR family transcriptional regulator [Govania unica]
MTDRESQIEGLNALDLWRHVLVSMVQSNRPDLTTRQLAILLTLYAIHGEHTVRGIAALLGLAKPVVTRALDRLGKLGFIRRERDSKDGRSIYIRRTVKGAVFLSEFAASIASAGQKLAPEEMSP